MGCLDFEIVFRLGRKSSKPDALSRQPDLAPSKEDKLTFGQLLRTENITPNTFAEVAEFDCWFEDKSVDLDDAKHWFQVDILGVEELNTPSEDIPTDSKLISQIRSLTPSDFRLTKLISACENPVSSQMKEATKHYLVKDGVLYKGGVESKARPRRFIVLLRSATHPTPVCCLGLIHDSLFPPASHNVLRCHPLRLRMSPLQRLSVQVLLRPLMDRSPTTASASGPLQTPLPPLGAPRSL
ncbi:hypothetical protein PGT21_018645 [Puccinia graminis f. sp. tritici]|uniref:Uncharacterized protein n=1 Tax=Puccinia graminis f. sp. tritici TaxID=56615 RepID=A0A5B0PXZ4_PUCGR|nr:hypothetical protein PGT21_018645 [Puccinia graminis f. sp. tritici]